MTSAADILADKVREARRFRYIADDDGTGDALARLLQDEWDTAEEFEQRGGGDCDGWSLMVCQRADEEAQRHGITAEWRVIVGKVLTRGSWGGHMWVALVDEQGREVWADPTWGVEPAAPEWLGFPDTRRPVKRWTHRGAGHFDHQQEYPEAPA